MLRHEERGFAMAGVWPAVACWLVLLLCCSADVAGVESGAGRGNGLGSESAQDAEAPELDKRVGELGRQAQEEVRRQAGRFGAYLEGLHGELASRPRLRWAVFAVGLVVGGVFLFLGWALFRAFFVPMVVISGVVGGGFVGLSLLLALGGPEGGRYLAASSVLGMISGGALCLLLAMRAKPLAVLSVVFIPFLILSCILFPFAAWLGLAAFGIGVVLGGVSMFKTRSMMVLGTSVLGATALMACWRILAGALEGSPVALSWGWLCAHPLMVLLVFCVVVVLGVNIQMSLGPGELEAEDMGLRRRSA